MCLCGSVIDWVSWQLIICWFLNAAAWTLCPQSGTGYERKLKVSSCLFIVKVQLWKGRLPILLVKIVSPPTPLSCRMLGKDELSSLVKECSEILSRVQTCLETSSPASVVISQAFSLFDSFICKLDKVDCQQDDCKSLCSLYTIQWFNCDSPTVGNEEIPNLNPGTQETTSERKMRFQEVSLLVCCNFSVSVHSTYYCYSLWWCWQRLRQLSSRSKPPSAYDKLKTQLLDELMVIFETHLISPSSLPLHEIFYFDQITSLKMVKKFMCTLKFITSYDLYTYMNNWASDRV